MNAIIEVAEVPLPHPVPNQKTKIVMIPENLNLEKHLEQYKPEGFRPDINKMKYLIGLLTELPYKNKRIFDKIKEHDKIPFIRLSSQLLKKKIRNYEWYVGYLVETGIIEKDDDYRAGKFCKGYRFTKKYRTLCEVERIHITGADTKIVRLEGVDDQSRYSELSSWFEGLDIDADGARNYLQDLYKAQLAKKSKRRRTKKMEKFYLKHSAYKLMVETIAAKEFFFVADNFSNRVHTSLSNLKSELRNFLTYKGEPLASIDLSCSQPFLILNLLEESFYDSESELIN